MVAALGVVMDTETGKQLLYGGQKVESGPKHANADQPFHRDDILSIDISADRKTVVTGESGPTPACHVWNPETGEKISQFSHQPGSRGIAACSISPCNRYVATVDLSNDHRVTIYNIERQKNLLTTNGSTDKILDVAWSKREEDLRFATVTPKQVTFWHPADVTKRLKQPGVMGRNNASTTFTSVAFDEEGWCYSGGDNGQIQVWSDACQAVKCVKAHAAGVTSLTASQGKLISGGKDKRIAIMSGSGGNFKLEKFIDISSSFPRSIDYFNGNILVGLRNGSVLEFKDAATSDSPTENIIMQSHFEGEIWGLEVVGGENKVITSGDDNKVMMYDYSTRTFDRKGTVSDHKSANAAKIKAATASSMSIYPPNQQARAICYSPVHKHLVICSNMGKVSIRDFTDFDKKLTTLKEAQEWCEVARYSPCQNYLAIGSHDNNLYVYKIADDGSYSLYKSFAKHTSFITAFDWSADSTYIRTVCGAYEKLYFNIPDKQHDSAGLSNTKDTQWATHTCKLGWDVQGVHPQGEDGTHINQVNTSPDESLLVACDDWGLVNVYNYPCLDNSFAANSYTGHSEHVVRSAFSPDGQRMFTIGGQDKALIQWKRK